MERAEYLTSEGKLFEKGSIWYGKGADKLGLTGVINKKQFTDVLEGKLPAGQQVGLMGNGKVRHRPGFDLTLSVCKSWSIAHYETKDPIFAEITEEAAKFTFDMIERDCAMTNMFADGKQHRENTGNLVGALHFHRLSRELDMQDHIHMIVMNMTERSDGAWRALKSDTPGKPIHEFSDGFIERVRSRQKDYGFIHRSRMGYLAQKYGMVLEFDKDGEWELKFVDKGKIDEFSTRRKQIEASMKKRGLSGAKAASAMALLTRKQKEQLTREECEAAINARLAKFPEVTTMKIVRGEHIKDKVVKESDNAAGSQNTRQAIDYAIAHLSSKQSILTEAKILSTAMHHHGKVDIEQLQNIIKDKEKSCELIAVSHDLDRAYISEQSLSVEKDIISTLQSILQPIKPLVKSERKFNRWLRKYAPLANDEQKMALQSSLRSNYLINAIDGVSGDKTSSLPHILAKFSNKSWLKPIVLVPSKIESELLQAESRHQCITVSGYLKLVEMKANKAKSRGKSLNLSEEVLIITNSHKLSTQQGQQLLKFQERYAMRSIMLFDSNQPESMCPGNFMSLLQGAGVNTVKLSGQIKSNKSFQASYVERQDGSKRCDVLVNDYVRAVQDNPVKKIQIIASSAAGVFKLTKWMACLAA